MTEKFSRLFSGSTDAQGGRRHGTHTAGVLRSVIGTCPYSQLSPGEENVPEHPRRWKGKKVRTSAAHSLTDKRVRDSSSLDTTAEAGGRGAPGRLPLLWDVGTLQKETPLRLRTSIIN